MKIREKIRDVRNHSGIIPSLLLMVRNLMLFVLTINISFAESLGLNDLIDSAFTNNPEISVAKSRYEAALKRTPLIRYLPDPWLAVEFGMDMEMYSISQEIPFPTKLSYKTRYARTEAEEIFSDYYFVVNRVIKEIKENYARLYLVQKELEILEQQKEILEQISIIANHNYRLNRVTQVDIIHTQTALVKLDNEIQDLKNEKIVLITALNRLINRPIDKELGIQLQPLVKPLISGIDSLYQLAKNHNPVLKSYQWKEDKAKINLTLARQEYLPDFMIRYGLERMEFENYKIMFGLTIPLWFWSKQKNMVTEMKQELKMAEKEYQVMENEILSHIKELSIMLDNEERRIRLYEGSIIPQYESALGSAMAAYEINRVDIMTVLETQKMLLEEKIEYQRTLLNYSITIAELEEITGINFLPE